MGMWKSKCGLGRRASWKESRSGLMGKEIRAETEMSFGLGDGSTRPLCLTPPSLGKSIWLYSYRSYRCVTFQRNRWVSQAIIPFPGVPCMTSPLQFGGNYLLYLPFLPHSQISKGRWHSRQICPLQILPLLWAQEYIGSAQLFYYWLENEARSYLWDGQGYKQQTRIF